MLSNINRLIESIVNKIAPILNHLEIKIKVTCDSGLENFSVNIDSEKMELVILNLIYNAMDALKNKKGSKRIRVKSKLYKRDRQLLIIVADNGQGILPEILPNIFKPFYTTNSKGMGLGLANVERIVSLHNGKIEVKTEIKKFTEFRIFLPC